MEYSGAAATTAQGMLLATLITLLHREGVIAIETVIEQLQESGAHFAAKNPDQPLAREMVLSQLQELTRLAAVAGPFQPRS